VICFADQKFLFAGCLTGSAIAELLCPSVVHAAPRPCIPIAYVLTKSDKRFNPGDLLCVGDTISLQGSQPLSVLCFATGKIVDLPNGRIGSNGCGLAQEAPPQACGADFTFCVRPRGSTVARLRITEPYGSNIIQLRPLLSWQPVRGATSYRVRILGNVAWSTVTTQPRLLYPENQPSLNPGSAYRVIVSAYRGNQMLLSGEQTLNVLPRSTIVKVNASIAKLRQLNLNPDEVAVLGFDSIYRSHGLTDESIKALLARVRAGSRSVQVYQLLGQRLRSIGLPEKAHQFEQIAQRLTFAPSGIQANLPQRSQR